MTAAEIVGFVVTIVGVVAILFWHHGGEEDK